MGLNVDFQSEEAKELHRMDGELIVFVDLDHDQIHVPRHDTTVPPRLPEQLRKKLKSRLKKVMQVDQVFRPMDIDQCDYLFSSNSIFASSPSAHRASARASTRASARASGVGASVVKFDGEVALKRLEMELDPC